MNSTERILNKLAKWRTVFAGWQLGSRHKDDPESQAVRDHRELTMMLRVELNAQTQLLIKKGVFTVEEFDAQLGVEAAHLDAIYEKKFPGFKTTDEGLLIDAFLAAETMKNWRP